MNAGFSSLAVLKSHLLAEALRDGTEYDTPLTALGLGVAAAFEKFCNRLFYRTAGDYFYCSGNRDHCFLPRYPVETVTAIALKTDETTGFETQTGLILTRNDPAGYVYWGSTFSHYAVFRLTYTGGYWWDITEDASDSLPSGATALPDDLKLAWLLQCEDLWRKKDRLGISIATAPNQAAPIPTMELSPQVKALLAGRIRYA